MTRRRQVLVALLAAAALLSVSYLALRPAAAASGVEVPVCAEDVPAGTRIEAAMLTTVRVPEDAIPDGAVREAVAAVGLRTPVLLRKGEMLSESRLSADALGIGHPGAGPGRRIAAVSLSTDEAAGWWLSEGSMVDVHLLFPDDGGGAAHDVLAGIRVAAVMDAKGNRIGEGNEAGAPSVLCLDVDEAQAARLAEAELGGRIRVTIVNEAMEQKEVRP